MRRVTARTAAAVTAAGAVAAQQPDSELLPLLPTQRNRLPVVNHVYQSLGHLIPSPERQRPPVSCSCRQCAAGAWEQLRRICVAGRRPGRSLTRSTPSPECVAGRCSGAQQREEEGGLVSEKVHGEVEHQAGKHAGGHQRRPAPPPLALAPPLAHAHEGGNRCPACCCRPASCRAVRRCGAP